MPILREYRVVLPMTVEEYFRAREWHKVEKLKLDAMMVKESQMNEFPEEVLANDHAKTIPFFGKTMDVPCEHTVKRYGGGPSKYSNVISRGFSCFGNLIDVLMTGNTKITDIEAWDGYPYYKSVSKNYGMQDSYTMTIEAIYKSGNGELENALDLPEKMLKEREVILVDISANVSAEDYRDGKDPALFRSDKTGRGRLIPGKWMDTADPCMTCYIVIHVKYDLLGLGRLVERKLQEGVYRALVLHHRELFCFIDKWIDLSVADIKKAEEEAQFEFDTALDPVGSDKKALLEGGKKKGPDEESSSCIPATACCPLKAVKDGVVSCCGFESLTMVPLLGIVSVVVFIVYFMYGNSFFGIRFS